ncbi:hypothetical protein [Bacteroides acidifaciens]|uniref:hypothetical protein n=1 Tax=Bacteroides acidifaciens TaxID=85831 RepID=UPI003F6906B2
MDYLHPPDKVPSQNTEEANCFMPRLSVGCEVLSSPKSRFAISFPRTDFGSNIHAYPTTDIILCPDSVQFYLFPTVIHARRNHLPRSAVKSEKSPLIRAMPGYDAEMAFLMLFEGCLAQSIHRS